MSHTIEFGPRAAGELEAPWPGPARRVISKILTLRDGLTGDVKRLTNTRPAYRLQVGDYRALFDIDGERMRVYRIRHRRKAYGPSGDRR